MGLTLSDVAPERVQIYGNGGRMLPQRNNVLRTNDLTQNAILVKGQEDGRFDAGDAIYFYAEGPRTVAYDSVKSTLFHEINIYADTAYYYLTIGEAPGLRIKSQPSLAGSKTTPIEQFDDYWFHEMESVNLLRSGRDWWGEYLGSSSSFNIQAQLPGLIPSSDITLLTSGIAAAQVNTRMMWQLNGQLAGESAFGTITGQQYDIKAIRADGKFVARLSDKPAPVISLTAIYDKNGQTSAQAYLNYFALQVKRELRPYDDQLAYYFVPNQSDTISFKVRNVTPDWYFWNVTNPGAPYSASLSADGTYAQRGGKNLQNYVGFTLSQAFKTDNWHRITNQNIRKNSTPDLLIITASAWKTEAQRLAEFREQNDALETVTVTVEEIYNEFSSGKPDITALRDYIRHLYKKNPAKLKYVLLFGDATYDYRNSLQNQSPSQRNSWIPVYESRESLNPIYTYSSDDYFGFLKDSDGEWLETFAGDHTMDIGVGRLPVKNVSEARVVVDKLIHYASEKTDHGIWRNKVSFVADDGDGGIHQEHADLLAKIVQTKLMPSRIFLDAYPQTTTALGQKSPGVNAAIKRSVQEGALILNYTGHGGTSGWAEEQIWTLTEMQAVRGYNNLPLLITATCDFGRYDDAGLVSGGEQMVLSPRGAAIAAVSTTRPVYSSTNFLINRAFYEALISGGPQTRMGDIFRLTKNNSLVGSLNRNFALLGDPSMKLARGQQQIRWREKPDTLRALQKVKLRGGVYKEGETRPDEKFNGTARVTIYDKQVSFRTLGNEGDAKSYSEFRSKLFDGNVVVTAGVFTCEFVMPKDIDYRLGTGRVSVYAVSSDSLSDAAGQLDVTVGGSAEVSVDNEPPKINGYMNSVSFKSGDKIPASSILFLKLRDENGINISTAGIGHGILLIINDSLQIGLNDYYTADQDRFDSGTVRYPFDNLPSGDYTIRIKVWDTYNNSSELTFGFQVGLTQGISFNAFKVYPNPFDQELSFEFNHTRGDEDIEVTFSLYLQTGRQLSTFKWQYYNSEPIIRETIPSLRLNLLNTILNPYIYSLQIRSLKDNSVDRKSGILSRSP